MLVKDTHGQVKGLCSENLVGYIFTIKGKVGWGEDHLFILFNNQSMLGLRCCVGFSLVVASRGYSPVVVCGLLITVVSLVTEHGLDGVWASVFVAHGLTRMAPGLSSCDAGFSCFRAGGIFQDQGLNPCLLRWQVDSLPLSHEESPLILF